MIPPFEIEGGLPLAFARFAAVAGLACASGTLFYAQVLRPAGMPALAALRLRRLGLVSVLAAMAGTLLWLAAQAQDMAGSMAPDALWSVLSGTMFGHLLAARLVLLALATAALTGRAGWLAAGLGLAALVLQAGHSHAMAMGSPAWLLACAALHVLAAGIWLGGLPALWLALGGVPPALAKQAARRFSVAGLACVAVLLGTAVLQFGVLVTGIPGLVGTAYGWMVGLKMVLFAALLALAARNRFRLTPALAGGGNPAGRLRRAIVVETGLGLAVLAAAGVLTELQPAMHLQKLWPFGWTPSLAAAREDPDILREVAWAGAAVAGGLLLLGAAAVLARRRRWAALTCAAAGSATCWLAAPHFSPLLVPAGPEAFYHSPTGFSASAILAGRALFVANCVTCHGAAGRGDGPAAHALSMPPANLTAPHVWMHSDGEMFGWLTHGIEGPDGRLAMPGFPALSEDDRWDLIDYVRAQNAGLTLGVAGTWETRVQAPDMALLCGGVATRLSALRGAPVLLVLSGPEAGGPPGLRTVSLAAPAAPGACAAEPGPASLAWQIVAPGAGAVLIDAHGWLRRAAAAPAGLAGSVGAVAAAPWPIERPAMAMEMDRGMKM